MAIFAEGSGGNEGYEITEKFVDVSREEDIFMALLIVKEMFVQYWSGETTGADGEHHTYTRPG